MESLVVPFVKILIEHPQWSIFVNITVVLLIVLLWKFSLNKQSVKINKLAKSFEEHNTASELRGIQIETTKDAVMELKGLIAGMSNHRGLK